MVLEKTVLWSLMKKWASILVSGSLEPIFVREEELSSTLTVQSMRVTGRTTRETVKDA